MKVSSRASALAAVMDREQINIENIGLSASRAYGSKIRMAAIRAYASGEDVATAVRRLLTSPGKGTFVETLTQGMALANITGYHRAAITAPVQMARTSTYKSAIKAMKGRAKWSQDEVDDAVKKFDAEGVRVMQLASRLLEQRLESAVASIIESGVTVKEGKQKLAAAFIRQGITTGHDYLLETLFRTQTQIAYSVGRSEVWKDPAVDEILWGFEYVTVGDDRVRDSHILMEGCTRPKDDPMWSRWTPPNGYNCRCTIIEVFDEGTSTDRPEVSPDDGFAYNPADIFL